jgi:hypothetical protein
MKQTNQNDASRNTGAQNDQSKKTTNGQQADKQNTGQPSTQNGNQTKHAGSSSPSDWQKDKQSSKK